jgi:hypothetical protein
MEEFLAIFKKNAQRQEEALFNGTWMSFLAICSKKCTKGGYSIHKAGQCRTDPWPPVPDCPWWYMEEFLAICRRKCTGGDSIQEFCFVSIRSELRNWLFRGHAEFRWRIVFFRVITKTVPGFSAELFSERIFDCNLYLVPNLRRPVLWRWRGRVSQHGFVEVRGWPHVDPGGRGGPLPVLTEVEA